MSLALYTALLYTLFVFAVLEFTETIALLNASEEKSTHIRPRTLTQWKTWTRATEKRDKSQQIVEHCKLDNEQKKINENKINKNLQSKRGSAKKSRAMNLQCSEW